MIKRTQHNKENPYTLITNKALNDPHISWGAKGLLTFMLSKPDDWHFNSQHLKTVSSDKITATDSRIKELISFNYITRTPIRIGGQFKGYDYNIMEQAEPFEVSQTGETKTENLSIESKEKLNTDIPIYSSKEDTHSEFQEVIKQLKLPEEFSPVKPNGKTMIRICSFLKALSNDDFLEKYPISSGSIKRKKINIAELSDIKTPEKVAQMLRISFNHFATAHQPDFFPIDKTKLSKNLYVYIYNPYSETSPFLEYYFSKPEKIADDVKNKIPDQQRARFTEYLKRHPDWPVKKFWDSALKTYQWIESKKEHLQMIPNSMMCNNVRTLLERFVEFESDFTKGNNTFNITAFGAGNDFWNRYFLPWLDKTHGIKLRT